MGAGPEYAMWNGMRLGVAADSVFARDIAILSVVDITETRVVIERIVVWG